MSPKAPRPQAVNSVTIKAKSNCGPIFVTVTFVAGKIFEVFIRFGKAGGCGSAMADAMATLISYGLRSGLEPEDAVKALSGISCHLGPATCMAKVAESIKYVIKHLATGADIDEMMLEDELAVANSAH